LNFEFGKRSNVKTSFTNPGREGFSYEYKRLKSVKGVDFLEESVFEIKRKETDSRTSILEIPDKRKEEWLDRKI
jgi:hypothetical protein